MKRKKYTKGSLNGNYKFLKWTMSNFLKQKTMDLNSQCLKLKTQIIKQLI